MGLEFRVAGIILEDEDASQLRISVKTIETHRAQVMRRLEIHDLAGLVRYAIRVGVVSSDQ